eukprot:303076-Chlamydomonas_euryale.AAC.6
MAFPDAVTSISFSAKSQTLQSAPLTRPGPGSTALPSYQVTHYKDTHTIINTYEAASSLHTCSQGIGIFSRSLYTACGMNLSAPRYTRLSWRNFRDVMSPWSCAERQQQSRCGQVAGERQHD